MSDPLHLTDRNFEEKVLSSHMPVLVDFWASWCPPCKMMEPIIAQLAREHDGEIQVGKLHVDQNPRIASHYQIVGVPTFAVFRSGDIILRKTGAQSRAQLEQMLVEALAQGGGAEGDAGR